LIARFWHGVPPETKADKYSDFLHARAIQGFAGEPADRAKQDPEDRDCLLGFEPKVQHWEVVGSAKP
jgi:hypothetical protein